MGILALDSTGETLLSCIKDVFLRLNIPIERIAGFCFDGAANMSGCFSGVDRRRSFFEAIDVTPTELGRRFDQASTKLATKRERAVIKAAEGRSVNLEAFQLPGELDTDRLELQLKMLGPSVAKQLADVTKDRGSKCVTVQDVASCFTKLQPQTRAMFSETENRSSYVCAYPSPWPHPTALSPPCVF